MYLPDINFWLALAFVAHVHHRPAHAWFDRLLDRHRCFFCRITQQGFLRLANNPRAFPDIAVTQVEAWRLYDALASNPRVEFVSEPPTLETRWRQETQLPQFAPLRWSDAFLAAFAQAADLEVVTFDKGFSQFANLRHTILS